MEMGQSGWQMNSWKMHSKGKLIWAILSSQKSKQSQPCVNMHRPIGSNWNYNKCIKKMRKEEKSITKIWRKKTHANEFSWPVSTIKLSIESMLSAVPLTVNNFVFNPISTMISLTISNKSSSKNINDGRILRRKWEISSEKNKSIK